MPNTDLTEIERIRMAFGQIVTIAADARSARGAEERGAYRRNAIDSARSARRIARRLERAGDPSAPAALEEARSAWDLAHSIGREQRPRHVLVETIPASDRASHSAAGNSGRWPHNGAVRYLVPADVAEDLEDEWTEIVRDATAQDRKDYEVDEDGERTRGA